MLQDTNRLAEAEPLDRRALAIDEKSFGPEHPNVARNLNNLAQLLQATNRLAEAEPLMRRALAIDEKSFGPEHPNVARDLNNLAALLQDTNRLAEAEPLMRRALAIDEKSFGPEHPNVAIGLNNLARCCRPPTGWPRPSRLMRRALAIDEKSFGPEHPNVAIRLNNLAELLQATNRLAEAEPLMRRALAIDEKSFGPDHPDVARDLNNLAQLLQATNRLAEAEPLMRRALAIDEKSFGPEHPNVAIGLNNLAVLRAELGDWVEAAAAAQTRKANHDGRPAARRRAASRRWRCHTTPGISEPRPARCTVPAAAKAREEGFELAQWALQTGAADALSQMSARFAKGAGPLARPRARAAGPGRPPPGRGRRLLAAVGEADTKARRRCARRSPISTQARCHRQATGRRVPRVCRTFHPKPFTLAAVQALLRADEALVLFLDVPRFGRLPEETLAWVVTKTEARWMSNISAPGRSPSASQRCAAAWTARCG